MYKKILISLIGALIIAAGVTGTIIYKDMFLNTAEPEAEDGAANSETENVKRAGDNRKTIQGTVTKEELEEYEAGGLNPFGEDLQAAQLTDEDFQEYIHGMTHQKVRAKKKWGFYELHPKRVTWLLEALNDADGIERADDYEKILHKWDNEDYSTIDEDHNVIWRMQGGTVGKATGILSQEEELDYLDSQTND